MSIAHDPSRKRSELPKAFILLSLVDLHFTRGDGGRYHGGYNQMRTHVISFRLFCTLLFASFLLLSACGAATGQTSGAAPTAAPTVLDAYGKPIAFPKTAPQRIISLAPSTSEILAALHQQSHLVGADYYTNYPADVAKVQKIASVDGTFNNETIVALHPDLVLSAGGITKDEDAKLSQLGLHVVDFAPGNFEQSLQQIILVGRLTQTESAATTLVHQLQQQVEQIKEKVKGTAKPNVLMEIDDSTPGKPFVFGGTSFGDEMLQDANASNIFHSNTGGRGYPQVTDEAIIAANPQFVILTEDPLYGGDPQAVANRPNWNGIDAIKALHVYHINSDIMQRPGPRLVQGLQCVAQIVHPDTFSGSLPAYCSASV